jgi:hypothetical protein
MDRSNRYVSISLKGKALIKAGNHIHFACTIRPEQRLADYASWSC